MLDRRRSVLPAWLLLAVGLATQACRGDVDRPAAPPHRLAETGLYADFESRRIAADVLTFSPQYPLWSDGARKQRWIRLPPGGVIDARDPDAWRFPIGTKLWKEFTFERTAETRFMELGADGCWTYATYVWNEAGTDAVLAPDRGLRRVCETLSGCHHDVPSVLDCRACHESGPTPVLGFSALQLSDDRDPLAPHAESVPPGGVGLRQLVASGRIANLPADLLENPPRVAAATPTERAVLGYLHANCAGCHSDAGPLRQLGMSLHYPLSARLDPPPAIATTVGQPSRFVPSGEGGSATRIVPGRPEESILVRRIGSRDALLQMPPLGTHVVDHDALNLIEAWVRGDLAGPRRSVPF